MTLEVHKPDINGTRRDMAAFMSRRVVTVGGTSTRKRPGKCPRAFSHARFPQILHAAY